MRYLKTYIRTFFENQFLLAFFILGLALSFISLKAMYYYYFSDYSVPVIATVVGANETVITNSGGRENRSYVLKYTYQFEGKTYRSDRYQHSHSTPSVILQHKPGDTLEAYLNPNDPADAVIVNEITWTNILGSILGPLLVFGSLILHGRLSP